MELTKSRRKRVEPRMPGIGIADRYLMNFHRSFGFRGPKTAYFTGGALKTDIIFCGSFGEPPKGCAGPGDSASPGQRLATRLASQNCGNAPG